VNARGIAGRIAAAATGFALAAALVPLLPFGLAEAPVASIAILLLLPAATWLMMQRTLTAFPEQLVSITTELRAVEPGTVPEAHRTAEPRIAALAVEIDSLLRNLDRVLTRHRDARLEAEEEDRSETEFLTQLSHELRTPLNSILGFSQVLLDDIDGPLTDSQREDVETIRASGEHLSALVDDVLDMAALHSGQVTLEKRSIEVSRIVVEVTRLLGAQVRDQKIVLKSDIADDLPPLSADEKRLRQILMNLGTNALKFTEEGTVRIEAAAEDEGIRLSVHDTGPGIPPSERDSIFLEFTQVSGSVMRRTQGSGLGLAIVKRLTELHGGRIWLDTVTGEGSSFHVWFPIDGDAPR